MQIVFSEQSNPYLTYRQKRLPATNFHTHCQLQPTPYFTAWLIFPNIPRSPVVLSFITFSSIQCGLYFCHVKQHTLIYIIAVSTENNLLNFFMKFNSIYLCFIYALYSYTTQSRLLMPMKRKLFRKHFLLFQKCFLPIPKRISVFMLRLFCCPIWTSLKFCHLVKG